MTDIVQPHQLVIGTRYIVRDNNRDNPLNRPYIRNGQQVLHPNGQPVFIGPNNRPISQTYTAPFIGPDHDITGRNFSVFSGDVHGNGPFRFPNDSFTFYRDPTSTALNNPRNLAREFGGKRKSKRNRRKSRKC